MITIEYWYDFSSPYAYLAHEAIADIAARRGATLAWRPFLLGGLFRHLGVASAPILSSPGNKRDVLMADLFRWAEWRGLPLAWPSQFPLNTVRPLRVMGFVDPDRHAAVAGALFRAYWGDGADIADPAVIAPCLTRFGLDADRLLAAAETPAAKAQLIDATALAFQRGLCGAPSFFVGDLLVWGQDRLEFVDRMAGGWVPRAEGATQ